MVMNKENIMLVSSKKKKIKSQEQMAEVLFKLLNCESEIDQNKEHFWVIGFSASQVIQYVDLVTLGILNKTLVHPREVFRLAIMKGVASIIVAHNHPSGSVNPSNDDHNITMRLVESGKIIGIEVLDHLIINNQNEYYSFLANKTLNKRI